MGGIKSYIYGKNGNQLRVNGEGEIGVSVHTHPPIDENVYTLPFRQYFTDDGTSAGSNDMQVVGTLAAPLQFWIAADQERDIFIKTISIEISDQNATLNQFGNVGALTNGCKFSWVTADSGTIVINDALKTNWEFVRMCSGNPSFGDGTAAFRAGNVSGVSEGYIPIMDAAITFGLPFGFRLRKGTTDKLVFEVRDTTTGVDSFNAVGYGVQV